MMRRTIGTATLFSILAACSGGKSDSLVADAGTCTAGSTPGTLKVSVDIADGASADVRIVDAAGKVVGDPLTASDARSVPAGAYSVVARRVRKSGELVGPAYQPDVVRVDSLCVRGGEMTTADVHYSKEPGSERMWLTQSNGDGAQVMSFDAAQLAARGAQTPSVSLAPALNDAGPLRIDGQGRLWVASNTGSLVGYAMDRLGASSTRAPDLTLTGDALCEAAVPCGPRALAFDASGALYAATLSRIVRLSAESLDSSGEPSADITISSPDFESPSALAFDAEGNLWVGESTGAIVRFDAARLAHDIDEGAADVVIYAGSGGPVSGLYGSPEGLVFDKDGNLWVGYFTGNDLVRFTPEELARSADMSTPFVPSVHINVGVTALLTDLALDEAGNLWMPGTAGSLYTIAHSELSAASPTLDALTSDQIGTVERIAFNTVPGALFIAP